MNPMFGGIDNGNEGAIVVYDGVSREVVLAQVMPTINVGKAGGGNKFIIDEAAVFALLEDLGKRYGPRLSITLEKAQVMPGRDGKAQGAVSAFSYGQGYGAWRMALTAAGKLWGVRWSTAAPVTWNKRVLRDIEGDDTKARAVLRCQRSLPGLSLLATARSRKPHEGLADAGCLALYSETQAEPDVPMPPTRKGA